MTDLITWNSTTGYRVGDIQSLSAREFVAKFIAALKLEYKSDIDDAIARQSVTEGYVRVPCTVHIGEVKIVRSSVWFRAGWIEPNASTRLDGSPRKICGHSGDRAEWYVCESDDNGDGHHFLHNAIRAWMASSAIGLIDDIGYTDPCGDLRSAAWAGDYSALRLSVQVAEPTDQAVYDALSEEPNYPLLRSGSVCRCPAVAIRIGNRYEAIVHPDGDDVHRLLICTARSQKGADLASVIRKSITLPLAHLRALPK